MNKKIFFFSLIFIIILFIWKDYKKIDFHFVNQSKVTYNYKNLNNIFKISEKILEYISGTRRGGSF